MDNLHLPCGRPAAVARQHVRS